MFVKTEMVIIAVTQKNLFLSDLRIYLNAHLIKISFKQN